MPRSSDGRYTVQAEAQLDPQLFERHHLVEEPPAKWLGEQLSQGSASATIPPCTSRRRSSATAPRAPRQAPSWSRSTTIPIGWDRARPAIAPIRELDERYAGEAADAKRMRMGQEVAAAGAEVAAITAPDSIAGCSTRVAATCRSTRCS